MDAKEPIAYELDRVSNTSDQGYWTQKVLIIRMMDLHSSQVSRIERKYHAFRCNLTLSRRHEHFSRIGTFLTGNYRLSF